MFIILFPRSVLRVDIPLDNYYFLGKSYERKILIKNLNGIIIQSNEQFRTVKKFYYIL